MTIQEFRKHMASGKSVIGGSDVHMMFHQLSQEVLKIMTEINGKYYTPEELHNLLEELWGHKVPKTVIQPDVTIGNGAVISTGSVVTKSVAPRTLVAGNPAIFKKEIKKIQLSNPYNESPKHWIGINPNTVSDNLLKELTQNSYEIVKAKYRKR